MLAKHFSLVNKNDIKNILKYGFKLNKSFFFVKYSKSEINSKFAISISAKTFSKAVTRNAIKRKMKESIRNNIEILSKTNIQALFVVKKEIKNNSFNEIDKNIKETFIEITK